MPEPPRKAIALLAYHDPAAIHDFVVEAFGLRPGLVERDGAGRPVHAEVHTADGSTVYLRGHAPEAGLTSPRDVPASTGGVFVVVDDVDAHCQRARERGARIDYGRPTRTTGSVRRP